MTTSAINNQIKLSKIRHQNNKSFASEIEKRAPNLQSEVQSESDNLPRATKKPMQSQHAVLNRKNIEQKVQNKSTIASRVTEWVANHRGFSEDMRNQVRFQGESQADAAFARKEAAIKEFKQLFRGEDSTHAKNSLKLMFDENGYKKLMYHLKNPDVNVDYNPR